MCSSICLFFLSVFRGLCEVLEASAEWGRNVEGQVRILFVNQKGRIKSDVQSYGKMGDLIGVGVLNHRCPQRLPFVFRGCLRGQVADLACLYVCPSFT